MLSNADRARLIAYHAGVEGPGKCQQARLDRKAAVRAIKRDLEREELEALMQQGSSLAPGRLVA